MPDNGGTIKPDGTITDPDGNPSKDYFAITFDPNGGEGTAYKQIAKKGTVTLIKNRFTSADENNPFTGWTESANGTGTVTEDGGSYELADNVTLYAKWGNSNNGGGSGGGGHHRPSKPKPDEENPNEDQNQEDNNTNTNRRPVADPTVTGVANLLDTTNHNAYMSGYGNGTFNPNANMTRAEAAQMFYNLLLNKDVEITTTFTDVAADKWYAQAVNVLASMGIIKGVGEGQFAPERTITRAEFAAIATRFANASNEGGLDFTDIGSDAWYYSAVLTAVNYGWINGYPDGSFKPNNTITRAEVVIVVNNMLKREAVPVHVDEAAIKNFSDVTKAHWAYYQIAEATTSH